MSDSIDILTKLFDTLKDASDKNEQATQRLVEQQIILVGKIRNMPIDELRTALKDHAKKSDTDFVSCTGIIELKTTEIKDLIKLCLAKINKMFLIISLAVSISTGGYFILRYLSEDHIDMNVLREELREERKEEQSEMIKAIKKEIQRHHLEENGGMNK